MRERGTERIKRILQTELIRPETALAFSFFTPVLIYTIALVMRNVAPFGTRTIFGSDLYHQYGPFFAELFDKLKKGDSLWYSWNMGLGMNFWALAAYYLASPLTLLLAVVPQRFLVEAMTFLIVLKVGLCSLSMTWYLRSHCKTYDFGVAVFGIFYGMSGYVTAYHWNLMWMDGVIMLPLILRGAELLVLEGRWRLYCIALGLSIGSNYYISIMTCLFLLFYVPALLWMAHKSRREAGSCLLRFAGASLLAGSVCAVLLLPAAAALSLSYAGSIQPLQWGRLYFPVFSVLARHLANVTAEYELAHWPNIYCGVAVCLLVPLYLLCGKIPGRERAACGALAAFLFLSFCWEPLDYLWHGLHFPNCFPARQGYLYVFLLLFMGYRAWLQLANIPDRRVAVVCGCALVLVGLAWRFWETGHETGRSYGLTVCYLLLYMSCILFWKRRRKLQHTVLTVVFSVAVVEAAFSLADNGMFDNDRSRYTAFDEEGGRMIASLRRENSFFRIKATPVEKANMGAWLHYPAMESFSSTNNASVSRLFWHLGCESSVNYYSSQGATPLVDLLFGIGYDMSLEEKGEADWRRRLREEGSMTLYQLEKPLPLGFQADPVLEEALTYPAEDPAEFQNHLMEQFGLAPVLIPAGQAEQQGEEVLFMPEQTGEYYGWVSRGQADRIETERYGQTRLYEMLTPNCLIDLGMCQAGEELQIRVEGETSLQMRFFRFDGSGLSRLRSRIVRSQWEIMEWEDTRLAGTIRCDQEGMMMTTVPYDPGWSVYVDGKKASVQKVLGAFIGVSLTRGEHKLEWSYCPPGFRSGAVISAVSIWGLAACFLRKPGSRLAGVISHIICKWLDGDE